VDPAQKTAIIEALQLAVIHLPRLNEAMRTQPLTAGERTFGMAVAILAFVVIKAEKRLMRRGDAPAACPAAQDLRESARRSTDSAVLHLVKLAVGPRDVAELRALQAERQRADPPLRHRTRMFPRRAAEIVDGGSIYWVVAGFVRVRQRVIDIREDRTKDGGACAAIVLDPALVPVEARPVKAFQGWRYLAPEDAPPDLAARRAAAPPACGLERLPPRLRRALAELCLI
jgi:hypothetical protein